jgi:hypothetical protein
MNIRGFHHRSAKNFHLEAQSSSAQIQFQKRLLNWMQISILAQSFNRQNFFSRDLRRQQVTTAERFAIHQHGTRPAHADATTFLRADQIQVITQDFEQCSRPNLDFMPASVYIQNHS